MLNRYITAFLTLTVLLSSSAKAEQTKRTYRIPDDVFCEKQTPQNILFCTDDNDEPITGEMIQYFEGSPIRRYNIVDGKLNGLAYSYYTDGTKKTEIPYQNGQINGVLKRYNRMGKISEEISYQNDKKEGIAKYYNDSGALTAQMIYISDEALGDVFFYDDTYKTPIYRLKNHSGTFLSGTYTYLSDEDNLTTVNIPEIIITAVNNKCLDFQQKITTSPCAAIYKQNPNCNQKWRKANRKVVREYLQSCRQDEK